MQAACPGSSGGCLSWGEPEDRGLWLQSEGVVPSGTVFPVGENMGIKNPSRGESMQPGSPLPHVAAESLEWRGALSVKQTLDFEDRKKKGGGYETSQYNFKNNNYMLT